MKNVLKRILVLSAVVLLIASSLLLVGCKKQKGSKSITNLTYDGEQLQWTRVLKAKKYLLTINDGEPISVSQTDNEKIAYSYKTTADFNLKIEAVIKEGNEDNPKLTLDFVNIGKVENLRVEDGKLLWDELSGAETYILMKNGQVESEGVVTNEKALEEGAFQYKVRALKGVSSAVNGNNGYYSVWSDPISGTILTAPENIKFDSTQFTWDKVDGATSYVVKVNNEEFTTTDTKLDFSTTEDFTVSIKAVGNKDNKKYDSSFSEGVEYIFLEQISGLTVKDGMLDWNDVPKATGYQIKVNGIIEKEALSDSIYTKISSGQSYQIQILPIAEGGNYFSQWSPVQTINILAQPIVSFNGNTIMWTQVYNAGGYDVRITKGGEQVHSQTVDKTALTYSGFDFADAGEYAVTVTANAVPELGHYQSKPSSPYTVRRLGQTASITVTNNVEAADQVGISFSPVPNAETYTLKINGVTYATKNATDTTFAVNVASLTSNLEQSTVSFSIVATGTVAQNVAVLEGAPVTKEVTKLAAPSNVSISGGVISWATVNGAEAYVVTVDGHRTKVTTTQYHPDWTAGTHKVTVQAAGNGEAVISSSFSAEKSITKLNAPTALTIDNAGFLRWTSPNTVASSGFTVKLGNGQEQSANTNAFDLNSYITALAPDVLTQLSICAKGDGTNTIDSDFSKTSGIYRFKAPTNLAIQGTNLVWDEPTYNGLAPAGYVVTIQRAGEAPRTYNVTDNSWAGAELSAGTYVFTVKAVGAKFAGGDAISTWDSQDSMVKEFSKLPKVEVTKSGNSYTWASVPGASSYQVYVNGILKVDTKTLSYTPEFTVAGEQSIKIVAIGDTTSNMDSDANEFRQEIKNVATPTVNVTRNGTSLTVTVTAPVIGAPVTGYEVLIDNNKQPTMSGSTMTYNVYDTTHTVKVVALAYGFGADGIFYINSIPSAEANV